MNQEACLRLRPQAPPKSSDALEIGFTHDVQLTSIVVLRDDIRMEHKLSGYLGKAIKIDKGKLLPVPEKVLADFEWKTVNPKQGDGTSCFYLQRNQRDPVYLKSRAYGGQHLIVRMLAYPEIQRTPIMAYRVCA